MHEIKSRHECNVWSAIQCVAEIVKEMKLCQVILMDEPSIV
jgi:hypothetical protein